MANEDPEILRLASQTHLTLTHVSELTTSTQGIPSDQPYRLVKAAVTNPLRRLPPSWFLPTSDSYGDYGDDKAAYDA